MFIANIFFMSLLSWICVFLGLWLFHRSIWLLIAFREWERKKNLRISRGTSRRWYDSFYNIYTRTVYTHILYQVFLWLSLLFASLLHFSLIRFIGTSIFATTSHAITWLMSCATHLLLLGAFLFLFVATAFIENHRAFIKLIIAGDDIFIDRFIYAQSFHCNYEWWRWL